MLQLKKQAAYCIIKRRDIYTKLKVNSWFGCEQLVWARTAANASHGPEQLQKLQLQKQGGRALIASSREGIFTPSYELTKRTAAKARAASPHVGQCNACACQPASQYSASIVQCSSLFLNERTGFAYTDNQFF